MESTIKKIIIKSKVNNRTIKNNSSKNTKKRQISQLENCIEIKTSNIKYFYGCWIKAIHINTQEYFSGGFLTKILETFVFLRNAHNIEPISFNTDNFIFFVKKDSEHYLAMQGIELEREETKLYLKQIKIKLKNIQEKEKEFQEFENIKLNFNKIKNKFLELFYLGKVKILN
jgi:hypothetical protein